MLGSVARSVLLHAACSVLIVRPVATSDASKRREPEGEVASVA
jgi:hypothetical protein